MYPLSYRRASSVDEARRLFQEASDAAYLAGGHTLLPTMKQRLAVHDVLVDLTRIEAMRGISVSGDTLTIGGGMTHAEVSESSEVKGAISSLAAMVGSIGDAQVRHRGTIGGSIANNDPAADYPSAALALAATIKTDSREIAADDFFTALYETALEEGEIVTGVSFRIPETAGYAKFRNPASRYPMAGVFVAKHKDGSVRVGVTGAGMEGAFRWHEAEEALAGNFSGEALAGISLDPGMMMGDIHGSPEYRANLVAVMAGRALANLGSAEAII
ncbi:xanthine dehydrogenase family protein subunit M [Afifella sp. IM 167]|uniref:FAD binding domain-containing protein n=1 Tax=Afifella sp. IM 167 TaxID=2033586 RepID=UPI001CCD8AE5|nr:xanthine dehydrogenase family protein subunit M [Afifella sp. IM 167]MBZ8132961.1 carbon monoxide dehydrogenase [Afifella sp. IM 167]